MTKTERIEAFRAEYPELFKQVNGDRIQLTDEEYETTLAEWADNAIAKDAQDAAIVEAEAKKVSGKAKLKALGLSDAEIEALVG
jgi:hypothetical protein